MFRRISAVLLSSVGAALGGGIAGGLVLLATRWPRYGALPTPPTGLDIFALTIVMAGLMLPFVLTIGVPLVLPMRRAATSHPILGSLGCSAQRSHCWSGWAWRPWVSACCAHSRSSSTGLRPVSP